MQLFFLYLFKDWMVLSQNSTLCFEKEERERNIQKEKFALCLLSFFVLCDS